MKDGKFENQQERLKFLEKARNEGVYIKLETPIPSSMIYPKPCLNFATVAQAWYKPYCWMELIGKLVSGVCRG
jgi:hypothetical protein